MDPDPSDGHDASPLPRHESAPQVATETVSPSAVRPPLPAHRTPSRTPSTRVPKTPAFRAKALSIDVNVQESVPPVAVASPLAMFTSRKQPTTSLPSHPAAGLAAITDSHAMSLCSAYLEYGMVVSLVCDERDGIVRAEGFASREVQLKKLNYPNTGGDDEDATRIQPKLGLGGRHDKCHRLLSGPYRDCLFEVVPKMTYDATLALEELSASHSRGPSRRHSSIPQKPTTSTQSITDLKFKSNAEIRLNSIMYRKMKGANVLYGQSVQFRHVKTGRYLALDQLPLQFRGTDYAQVSLDKGSSKASFTILPRFKLRSRGTPVQVTDQLLLTGGTEDRPYSLYASTRQSSSASTTNVVGSSVHSSPWRIVFFDKEADGDTNIKGDVKQVRAGQCVRLFHLESASWLQYGHRRTMDHPSVALQYREATSCDDSSALSTESLWVVEKAAIHEGGVVSWKDRICLRHLLTGRYLAVDYPAYASTPLSTSRSPLSSRSSAPIVGSVVAQYSPHLFVFVPTTVTGDDDGVGSGDVALIQHFSSKSFVHSPETHASSMTDIRISSKALGDTEGVRSTFAVNTLPGARDEDAFKIVAASPSEVNDTLLLLSYKRALQKFVSLFDKHRGPSEKPVAEDVGGTLDPEERLARILHTEEVIGDLIVFCSDGMKQSGTVLRSRQSMFQSHQFIDVLMAMIKAPFIKFGGPFSIDKVATHNSTFKKSSRLSKDTWGDLYDYGDGNDSALPNPNVDHQESATTSPAQATRNAGHSKTRGGVSTSSKSSAKVDIQARFMQALNRVIQGVNLLLVHIFNGHRANEIYTVQTAMPVLMELLGNGFQTSLPLSYLLRESRNLVESITAYSSIIRNFFELIKTRGRSMRYMQFLIALCASRGRGVPKTQEAICELLFNPDHGFTNYVIVPMRACESGFEVQMHSLTPSSESSVEGTWKNLPSVYRDYYIHGKYRNLSQYCLGLLQLYVALCLDRNYVSIDYVQQTFPRENLLQAARDQGLPRSVRAALLDLIRVAYVDCEPQRVLACPSYTRIWPEVGQETGSIVLLSMPLDGYSAADLAFFGQVKELCISFFRNLHGTIVIESVPENHLLLAMLKLCKKMVTFGIYATHQDLSTLVSSLAELLDGRRDLLKPRQLALRTAQSKGRPHGHGVPWIPSGLRRAETPLGLVRRYSVTDGGTSLFTTMMDSVPTADPLQIGAQRTFDTDVNTLLRLNKSAVVDEIVPHSASSANRQMNVARQFGVDSATWNEYIKSVPGADADEHSTSFITSKGGDLSNADTKRSQAFWHGRSHPRAGMMSAISHSASRENPPAIPLDLSSHIQESNYQLFMEIKDEICGILVVVDSLRLDYQISLFLTSFRSYYGNTDSFERLWRSSNDLDDDDGQGHLEGDDQLLQSTGAKLFAEKSSPLVRLLMGKTSLDCKYSLAELCGRNITTILMQMLMYDHPPLVSKALELLLQQFNQHDQLLSALQKVQLLVSEETIAIYNRLKNEVNDLRRLSETTEVWMDLTSKSDFENAEWACALLKTIRTVIMKNATGSTRAIENSQGSMITPSDSRNTLHPFHRRASSGLTSISDAVAAAQGDTPTYAPRVAVDKNPPNRKTRHVTSAFVLNCALGKVSHESSCHDLLTMAKHHAAEFQPQRKVRSHSTVGSMAAETRRLLRNLKASQYVISMMEDGAHFYEAHLEQRRQARSEQGVGSEASQAQASLMLRDRQQDQIHEVFKEALEFLWAFCSDSDAESQSIVAPHSAMIARYAGDMEMAQRVLMSVYASNQALCKTVPTEVVNSFVMQLIADPTNPRYLYFLETIVLCDENPVHENQLLVLFQLIKCVDSGKILQLFDDPVKVVQTFAELFRAYTRRSLDQVHERESRVGPAATSTFQDGGDHSTALKDQLGSSRVLEYHVRLLNLFAACATGRNTRCQEICQQIIPLGVVADLLALPQCTEGIQFSLLRFLRQVYFSADDLDPPHDDDLHKVFTELCRLCARSILRFAKALHDEDVNRHAVVALHKSKRAKEMAATSKPAAVTPLDSTALYLAFYGVVPTIMAFMHQFPQYVDPGGDAMDERSAGSLTQLAHALVTGLTVNAIGEWTLPDAVVEYIDELCNVLDKLTAHTRGHCSLSTAWVDALSRTVRLDLSAISLNAINTVEEVAHSLLAFQRTSQPAEGSSDATTVGAHQSSMRTYRMRSKQEPSAVSESEGPASIGAIISVPPTHRALDHLSITEPKVMNAGAPNPFQVRGSNKWRGVEPRGTWQMRGPAYLVSSPISVLQRMGLRTGRAPVKENPYSRRLSAFNVQCSPLRTASTLFHPLQASMSSSRRQITLGHGHSTSRHHRFDAFGSLLSRLCSDDRIEAAVREELNRMVDSVLRVEDSLHAEYDAAVHTTDVRLTFDQVVARLVTHVQSFQDASYVKMNLILLDVFCRMIYAAEDDWERRHRMQIKLNRLNVTKLVVELISTRSDEAVFERSIELGVALLEGMNAEVQETFYRSWLENPEAGVFCEKIQSRIDKACQFIHHGYKDRGGIGTNDASSALPFKAHHHATAKPRRHHEHDKHIARLVKRRSVLFMETSEPSYQHSHSNLPEESAVSESGSSSFKVVGGPMTLVFRFLQLLCEGHFLHAQRYFISQPRVKQPVNLVETTTSFLLDTYLALTDLDIGLVIQLFETITEFCQGPCHEAQETVANFKFFSTANALLMHSFLDQSSATGTLLIRRLRAAVVITLLSLLEGRSDRVIHAQLVQELNFDALKLNLVDVYGHFVHAYSGRYTGNVKCSDDFYVEMGFNIYFLLQQLADCYPSSATWLPRADSGRGTADATDIGSAAAGGIHHTYQEAFQFFQTNSARVEIVWNLQRRDTTSKENTSRSKLASTKATDVDADALADEEGTLIPYYFPLHPMCFCLTEQSKKKLVWHVSRGANKLHDFYSRSDKLVDEMAHQSRLRQLPTLGAFARSAEALKRVSFILAVLINLLVLMYYQADGIDSRPYAGSHVTFLTPLSDVSSEPGVGIRVGLRVGGTIQLFLCSLVLLCYLINSAPLLIKKGWKRRIRAQQEKQSKKYASVHRLARELEDKASFQDTEQLLRSLREREDEYDYLFLPGRQHARTWRKRASAKVHTTSRKSDTMGHNGAPPTLWQRVWRFLYGPASVLIGSDAALRRQHAGGPVDNQDLRTVESHPVSTLEYVRTVWISLSFLFRSPRVLYYLWQISIAILGSYVNNLFFAFHLLDVINRYQELSNVLRSIVRPAKVLGVTLILYLIVVYVFSIVGFYFFRDDYNPSLPLTVDQKAGAAPYQCQRLFQCFLISLDQGLKSDGGLGGFLKYRVIGETPQSYARLLFDLLYNTILIIMLLNIVFGVIIDTFASLRTADHEKLMDMQNRCFICSIDAYTFDRATKRGFLDHIYSEHNMWHYLYLFVHIRKKPITEYNGLELYLAMRMAKRDVSFFPNHRSLSLETGGMTASDVDVVAPVDKFDGDRHGQRQLRDARGDSIDPDPKMAIHKLSGDGESGGATSRRRRSALASTPKPALALDRSVLTKLETLESTVQQLMRAQAELQEKHTRSLQRQTELLEMLASNQGLYPVVASATPPRSPPVTVQNKQPRSTSTAKRTGTGSVGILQRSPAPSASSAPSSTTATSRRVTDPPRVFNFDSVVDDLP